MIVPQYSKSYTKQAFGYFMTTHAIKIIRKMEFKERNLKTHSLTSDNCHQHRNLGISQIKEKRNILPLFFSSWYHPKRKVILNAKLVRRGGMKFRCF